MNPRATHVVVNTGDYVTCETGSGRLCSRQQGSRRRAKDCAQGSRSRRLCSRQQGVPKAVLKVAAAEASAKGISRRLCSRQQNKGWCEPERPAETPARLTGVKRGTMDEDIEIDVSEDHVKEANSLRVRMTAECQQELLLSEARETLRLIEALRKAFGH
jgi:hypothetical protein